jgi:radical SAM superfamily enzyme YgiQ (UPF0313 family)
MKILLVNPPRSPHNAILDHAPETARPFIHRKLIGPPLGLLTIAAAVKDHDVSLLEMKGEYDLRPDAPPPDALVAQAMAQFEPDIVGVTFIASEFKAGLAILRTAKRLNPRVLTVAGGLHATVCPHDFRDAAVDVVCLGPAAHSFRELVRAYERERDFHHVPGLAINTAGGLEFTNPPPHAMAADVSSRQIARSGDICFHLARVPVPLHVLFDLEPIPRAVFPARCGERDRRTAPTAGVSHGSFCRRQYAGGRGVVRAALRPHRGGGAAKILHHGSAGRRRRQTRAPGREDGEARAARGDCGV